MNDIIVMGIIGIIVAAAIIKIVVEKKRGNKCIGCPHGHANKKNNKCGCNK